MTSRTAADPHASSRYRIRRRRRSARCRARSSSLRSRNWIARSNASSYRLAHAAVGRFSRLQRSASSSSGSPHSPAAPASNHDASRDRRTYCAADARSSCAQPIRRSQQRIKLSCETSTMTAEVRGTVAGGIRNERPGRRKTSTIPATLASDASQMAARSASEVGRLIPLESENVSVSALKSPAARRLRSSVPVSSYASSACCDSACRSVPMAS